MGIGSGAENIAWHGWGKGTKESHAPHPPLSESTQFHMAHVMILIITFTESFSHQGVLSLFSYGFFFSLAVRGHKTALFCITCPTAEALKEFSFC